MINGVEQYKQNKLAKTCEDITCPTCGKVFKKKQYSQAFCCTHCKDKFHNRHGTIKIGNEKKKDFGKAVCVHCGKEFTKHHPLQRFCGYRCKTNYHNKLNPFGYVGDKWEKKNGLKTPIVFSKSEEERKRELEDDYNHWYDNSLEKSFDDILEGEYDNY